MTPEDRDVAANLLDTAHRYVSSQFKPKAWNVFYAALSVAMKSIPLYVGRYYSMRADLEQEAESLIKLMSWWNQWFYADYVRVAFLLVADVYESVEKRFVYGGEGEGSYEPLRKNGL